MELIVALSERKAVLRQPTKRWRDKARLAAMIGSNHCPPLEWEESVSTVNAPPRLRRHSLPALIERLIKAERADARFGEDLRVSVVARAELRLRRETARKELDAALASLSTDNTRVASTETRE